MEDFKLNFQIPFRILHTSSWYSELKLMILTTTFFLKKKTLPNKKENYLRNKYIAKKLLQKS